MNTRPSRKGLRIRPHKGGRTVELPKGKVTPEESSLVKKVVGDDSFSDWVVSAAIFMMIMSLIEDETPELIAPIHKRRKELMETAKHLYEQNKSPAE